MDSENFQLAIIPLTESSVFNIHYHHPENITLKTKLP